LNLSYPLFFVKRSHILKWRFVTLDIYLSK